VNITLKPIGEKTRCFASLQGIQKPDELDDLMLVSIFTQIGKCICIMGERMQFAPTNDNPTPLGFNGNSPACSWVLKQDFRIKENFFVTLLT